MHVIDSSPFAPVVKTAGRLGTIHKCTKCVLKARVLCFNVGRMGNLTTVPSCRDARTTVAMKYSQTSWKFTTSWKIVVCMSWSCYKSTKL